MQISPKLLRDATLAINRIQQQERCEGNLIDFAEYVWPVVEPAIPFVRGWVLEAIADHLQAVTDGYIKRLLINVPPGFTKSLMTDVFWPAWEWGPRDKPWFRYMCASYSNHLTERDNMRCRNIVVSDRYKKLWGNRFKISNEQFTKVKFANDKTGWKLATSVQGIGTGERADRVVIDDANNPIEMESQVVRDNVNLWFTEVIPDRLNSQKDSAIVVIQQRTHEDDVSGTALKRDMGYVHLCIPMRYEPVLHINGWTEDKLGRQAVKTFIGAQAEQVSDDLLFWEDPRTKQDELAWVERFPAEICDDLERDKGPYAWAGQYMQDPVPRGGSIIKRDYWQNWDRDKFPNFEYLLGSLDTAHTAKEENDPSALTIWGLFRDDYGNPKVMLVYAWEGWLEFHDLVNQVINTCTVSQINKGIPSFPVDKLLIEAKANGQSVGHELHRLFRGAGKLSIELIDPKKYGDKVARVHSIEHMFADQMIYAPDREWAEKVIKQVSMFPRGSHDDYVDSMSQALRFLRDCGFALRREEQSMADAEEMAYSGQVTPLYAV